ncbi:hypothetical protein [Longispora albida]|uniref:hypothetical protein n=1 Tax=Longispora albida TaxID=203523 RepID=UPI00037B893F|nr:hypothetical protein [Longispora albida]
MINLADLAASVVDFAASNTLTIIPAVPEKGRGPEVLLTPGNQALPQFLELVLAWGGGAVYLQTVMFDPDEEGDAGEEFARLRKKAGQIGEINVAFVSGGLVHFWTQVEPWLAEWRDGADARHRQPAPSQRQDGGDRPGEVDQAR